VYLEDTEETTANSSRTATQAGDLVNEEIAGY